MSEEPNAEVAGVAVGEPEPWEFAGWGHAENLTDVETSGVKVHHLDQAHKSHLGVWASTAICGNDITSSCLYVSALCAAQAGRYAPIVLGIVAVVLYLFRKVYAEVGSALPLNGGTYTVLLNTTNKKIAAGAAVLTLLSYVATAVISAGDAMHYAHNLWDGLNVFWATVALLGLFAFLNLIGISESAVVALVIFVFHIGTLIVLSIACGRAIIQHPELLAQNWGTPPPQGIGRALIYGFAAAMLGISGFESSANFIEEQKPGVFPKTLRNMWLAVAIFNPLISFLSLGMLPLATIEEVPPDMLAQMGYLSDPTVGPILRTWVSVDAVLVLSGAVLTSYVGVTGLVRRMSLDRCLPQFLLRENKVRQTNHYIIIGFFALCCSILAATGGVVETLAGVYTISFLCVMTLFAVGNMLLKATRSRLPRDVKASWPTVVTAAAAVVVGLIANLFLDPENIFIFLVYFLSALAAIVVMFLRIEILKVVLLTSRSVLDSVNAFNEWVRKAVRNKIAEITGHVVIYYTKGDDPQLLNRAALYVLENEQTSHMKVIHVYRDEGEIPDALAETLSHIDRLYPQLRIDFLAVKGTFGPELIEALSQRLGVAKNYMFIGTPGDHFPHQIQDLGGVRLIV
ncbi:MAG: APC family permease [Sandaracinaceae bacterium]